MPPDNFVSKSAAMSGPLKKWNKSDVSYTPTNDTNRLGESMADWQKSLGPTNDATATFSGHGLATSADQSLPVEANKMAFSDSGYASIRTEMEKHKSQFDQVERSSTTSNICQGAGEALDATETRGYGIEEGYGDNETNYSAASSTKAARKETYISELVEDLSKSIPTTAGVDDNAAMERFYSALPGILKSFARKIGHQGHCRESRDVMVFVSENRRYVLLCGVQWVIGPH